VHEISCADGSDRLGMQVATELSLHFHFWHLLIRMLNCKPARAYSLILLTMLISLAMQPLISAISHISKNHTLGSQSAAPIALNPGRVVLAFKASCLLARRSANPDLLRHPEAQPVDEHPPHRTPRHQSHRHHGGAASTVMPTWQSARVRQERLASFG
jgi:hypothetical protein